MSFTTYTDPGAIIQEVLVPTGINIPALPFAVCLVGVGSRNKRVTNEEVVRGQVSDESISPAGSAPHTAALDNRANKKLENTLVKKTLNGISTNILDQYVTFEPAYVLGTVTGTVDLSTNKAIAIEMDGEEAMTIAMHDTPAALTPGSIDFTPSTGFTTLTRAGSNFLTIGVRAGTTIDISGTENANENGGTFTVLTATQSVLTYDNAAGVNNDVDTAGTLNFSGTGFVGREAHVIYNFSNIAAATITEIAAALNQGLVASTSLGYGSDYNTAATVSSSALLITSPVDAPTSDVRVFAPIATSALVTIMGAPASDLSNRDAVSNVTIDVAVWSASATWTIDYVAVSDDYDSLEQTSDIQRIISIGSNAGDANFIEGTDFNLTTDTIDWTPDGAAVVTGIAGTTFDISPEDQLVVRMDGKLSITSGTLDATIDLNGLASTEDAPLGYTNPVSAAAATTAEVFANINAVLAAEFGPRYLAVASSVTVNGTTRVRITSPISGRSVSYVEIVAATSNSADAILFGGEVIELGTGKRPTSGSTYFVTYEYTRDSSEYDVPYRHFSVEAALAQVGQPSATTAGYNPLGIASQIAFENGSQFIYTCQVDDDIAEGNPTRAEVLSALDGAKAVSGATEIVVVGEPGTRLVVVTDMIDHLEGQSSSTERHYRRIFSGSASGTEMGDRDTVDSIIGRATRTLQVSVSSTGRGRMFNIAPPQVDGCSRDVVLDDGTEARLSLDATYLAVAVAARRTSLAGPAETLTNRTITGFSTDDITSPWTPAERRFMAGQGTLVITFDAGRFLIKDALSTEGGGGNKLSFKVDSTSYQKDVVTTKINTALDLNIIGIVPFDLATFILEIKLVVQGVLSQESSISRGTIGPYRDANGAVRPIDLRTDIRVSQDPDDQTQYNLSYFFVLRYPALRVFGQYSVDSPWFALSA